MTHYRKHQAHLKLSFATMRRPSSHSLATRKETCDKVSAGFDNVSAQSSFQVKPSGVLFEKDESQSLSGSYQTAAMAFADFNNDSYLDLILASMTAAADEATAFTLLYDLSDSVFSEELLNLDINITYSTISLLDYNVDGLMDLIIMGYDAVADAPQLFFAYD
jgi:hypothetical protein